MLVRKHNDYLRVCSFPLLTAMAGSFTHRDFCSVSININSVKQTGLNIITKIVLTSWTLWEAPVGPETSVSTAGPPATWAVIKLQKRLEYK